MLRFKEFTGFLLKNIVLPTVVIILVMQFILVNAKIPTGSMENTIMPGDRVIGVRLQHEFKRGDIVIFPDPDGSDMYLIKRIVGLPGETIGFQNNGLSGHAETLINGNVLTEDYLREAMDPVETPVEYEIPQDSYFVMGDNRNESYDARYWEHKFVKKEDIIGVAKFKYWPLTQVQFFH